MLPENQDSKSIYLTEHEKMLLTMRKQTIGQMVQCRQKLAEIERALVGECNSVLGIQDTPQGTQMVKKLHGDSLIMFHFV